MTQALLITPAEVALYGANSDLVSQFLIRQLEVKITTGGHLGTMAIAWRRQGDSVFSPDLVSETGAAWAINLPDPGFSALTFPDGPYVLNEVYLVSPSGAVSGGSVAGVVAARVDVVQSFCQSATSRAVQWMLPRVVPPVISVGPQIKEWIASLVVYGLKSRQGMAPPEGQAGDENVRMRAVDAEKELKLIGLSADRPPDLVDSSPDDAGAGFTAYPVGDDLRGW